MPPHPHRSNSISPRNFRIVAGTVLCAMLTLVAVLIIVGIARGSAGKPERQCFAVDMLEQRVPNWQMPLHRQSGGHMQGARPPLAFGEICFDRQQLVVEWKIKQSFSRLYTLRDMLLRGPLHNNRKEEKIAPSVLTLGVRTSSSTGHLHGSALIEKKVLEKVLEHPTQYYVSLEGDYEKFEKTSEGATVREIARHNLNYAI
jgi:hypothetical protein